VLVQGVPSTPEATTLAVHRIGAMRRTMYSDGLWDTAPRTTTDGDDNGNSNDVDTAISGAVAADNTSKSDNDNSTSTMSSTDSASSAGSASRSSGDSSLLSADAGVVDTAYTNMELLPHTDCTYYRDPPALQVFNCVQVWWEGRNVCKGSNS